METSNDLKRIVKLYGSWYKNITHGKANQRESATLGLKDTTTSQYYFVFPSEYLKLRGVFYGLPVEKHPVRLNAEVLGSYTGSGAIFTAQVCRCSFN